MYAEAAVEGKACPPSQLLSFEERVLELVREKKEKLINNQKDFYLFHQNMRDLERMLLRGPGENPFFEKVVNMLSPEELVILNDLYCLWETQLERRFVQFLDHGVVKHYLDYPLYARFERLIDRELSLFAGDKPKKLLFIGSGPMPITALCLQHRLGVQIDCLERFDDAVAESRLVMQKLNMEGAINVIQGYGENFDVSGYDAILVALLAKPKRVILENILKTASDDVRVICRTSDGTRCAFYEPTASDAIPEEFNVVRKASAGIDDTISSVLLTRR